VHLVAVEVRQPLAGEQAGLPGAADVGQVAFEMTALVTQLGPILTPQARSVHFPFVA